MVILQIVNVLSQDMCHFFMDKITIRSDSMKSEDFITVYATSREWRLSESFFEVLKSIPEYASWFKGDASKYGQYLILLH